MKLRRNTSETISLELRTTPVGGLEGLLDGECDGVAVGPGVVGLVVGCKCQLLQENPVNFTDPQHGQYDQMHRALRTALVGGLEGLLDGEIVGPTEGDFVRPIQSSKPLGPAQE